MGFFSDLRADLSQAVNELIPEEPAVRKPLGEDDLPDMPAGLVDDLPAPRHEKVIFHKIPEGMENVRTDWKAVVNEVTSVSTASDTGQLSNENGSVKEEEGGVSPDAGGEEAYLARGMTVIGKGTVITGEVVSENGIRLEPGAVLMGNLTATEAVIAGAVKGDIDVKGPVVLNPTAVVVGNIRSKSVRIDTGAVVEGMCSQCYSGIKPSSVFEGLQKDQEENQ